MAADTCQVFHVCQAWAKHLSSCISLSSFNRGENHTSERERSLPKVKQHRHGANRGTPDTTAFSRPPAWVLKTHMGAPHGSWAQSQVDGPRKQGTG